MKKRVLSALLALCMACTLAGNVWAAEETEPTPAPSAGVEAQTVEPQTVEPTPSAEPTQAPAPSPDATVEPEATPEPSVAPSAAPDATVEPDATPAPTEEPEATAAPAATATPDATADPTATPAPTEAPAPSEAPSATPAPTAEAEGEPVADGVEYAAVLEQDGQALNVIVTAPEGAFDAGVTPALSVTAIEDEAEGDAIAVKLDESGVTYDGFAALDISFKNEAGEEIEPKLPVTVRIELPEAIVDSGIDLNTLAVQHLAEDEAGNVTAVEQVASVADGTIALSEEAVAAMEAAEQAAEETDEAAIAPMMLAAPANDALTPDADAAEAPAVAEFEVSGFSTFTITWSESSWGGTTTYFHVTVHYVDENGEDITGLGADKPDITIDRDNNGNSDYTLNDYVVESDEYDFTEQILYSRTALNGENLFEDGLLVTHMRASRSTGLFGSTTRRLSFYNGEINENNLIDRLKYNYDTETANIYLVYHKHEPLNTIETVDSAANGVRISLFDYHTEVNFDYLNSYLGNFDWNGANTGKWNYWVSGNGVAQGILKSELDENGLPAFADGKGSNFDWLFTEEDASHQGNKTRSYYGNLNHLFSQDVYNKTGYYEYDSSENFATLEEDGFKVYNQPYKPGNVQPSTPKFLPFNDLESGDSYALKDDEGANYHFGMNVGFEFIQPEGGEAEWNGSSSPMRFEFTGDDDLWVFIDGVLVLDMGGVHDAQTGYIDFSTGEVYVSKVWDGEATTTTLKEIFAGVKGDEWVAENMTDDGLFKDYSTHTFELYYMERGGGGSNCRMRFNIQSIPAGTVAVSKQVNNTANEAYKKAEYQMQLLVKNEQGAFVTPAEAINNYERPENQFTVNDSRTETAGEALPGEGKFTVTGGTVKYIHNIPAVTEYKIQELGVNSGTGVTVTINGDAASIAGGIASSADSMTVGAAGESAVTVYNRFPAAPPEDFDITTGKRADLNDDGTYDLTLSTSGDIASVEGEQIKADILFVVDRSTSMWDDYRDYELWETSKSRMEVLKEAITGLVTEIESNDAIDANYNMVQFGTGSYNKKLLGDKGWTDASSKISNVLASIQGGYDDYYGGVGTNYQAGIKLAKEELQFVRDDARTYVIFLTDGDPTFHYTENGAETGGGSYTQPADIENAVKEIQGLSCDNFYAIGVSDDYTKDNLDRLCGKSSSHPNENGVNATIAQVYGASEDGDLPAIFDSIISEMTFFAAENVVMHDTLSQWADVPNASDVKFTVKLEHREQVNNQDVWKEVDPVNGANKVVDSGGSVHYTTDTTNDEGNPTTTDVYIIPTYNAGTKTIEVKLAANAEGTEMTYKLAPDYRYSVTLKIKPSDAAIREGMSGSNAQQEPDDKTGTHAEAEPGKELGFWSNVNKTAKVTYTVGDIPREKEFPKPVIRVQETFGNLTLVKSVVDGSQSPATPIEKPQVPGTDGGTVDAAYTFTIEAKGNLAAIVSNKPYYAPNAGEGAEPVITFSEAKGEGEQTTATATVIVTPGNTSVTIANLPTGTYTITEENPAAEVTRGGKTYYYVSNDAGDGVEANVEEDKTATATITNTYKPYRTVTITKNVMGEMGDTTKQFTFNTTIKRGENDAVHVNGETIKIGSETVNAELKEKNNFVTDGYTLANGEYITISKLKDGDILTIAESGANQNGYETSYTVNGDTSQNDTVTISAELADAAVDENGEPDNIVKVVVTNTRKVVTPTGLESNHTKPYALMVGAGALAGLALVGGILARRARRRREW